MYGRVDLFGLRLWAATQLLRSKSPRPPSRKRSAQMRLFPKEAISLKLALWSHFHPWASHRWSWRHWTTSLHEQKNIKITTTTATPDEYDIVLFTFYVLSVIANEIDPSARLLGCARFLLLFFLFSVIYPEWIERVYDCTTIEFNTL